MNYDVEKLNTVVRGFNKEYMLGGKYIRDYTFVPNIGFKVNFYKGIVSVYSSKREDLIPNYFETDVKPTLNGLRKLLVDRECKDSVRALEDMDRGEERKAYQVRVVDALISRFMDLYAVDFKDSMLFESAVFKQWLVDNVVGVVDGFDRVEDIGIVDVVYSNRFETVSSFAETFFNNFFNIKVEIGEEFYDEGVLEDCRDTLWWKMRFCGRLFFDEGLSIDEFNTMFSPDRFVLYCNDIELRKMTLSTRREDLMRVQQFTEDDIKQKITERYDGTLLKLTNSTNYLAGWKAFVFKDFYDNKVLIHEAIKVSERLIDSRKNNENEVVRNEAISNIFSIDNLISHRDTIRNSEDFNEKLKEFQEEKQQTIEKIKGWIDIKRYAAELFYNQIQENVIAFGITDDDIHNISNLGIIRAELVQAQERSIKKVKDELFNTVFSDPPTEKLEGDALKEEIANLQNMLSSIDDLSIFDEEREFNKRFIQRRMRRFGITFNDLIE